MLQRIIHNKIIDYHQICIKTSFCFLKSRKSIFVDVHHSQTLIIHAQGNAGISRQAWLGIMCWRRRVRVRAPLSPLLNTKVILSRFWKQLKNTPMTIRLKITAEFEQDLLENNSSAVPRVEALKTHAFRIRPGKAPYNMVLNRVGEAGVIYEGCRPSLEEEYPKSSIRKGSSLGGWRRKYRQLRAHNNVIICRGGNCTHRWWQTWQRICSRSCDRWRNRTCWSWRRFKTQFRGCRPCGTCCRKVMWSTSPSKVLLKNAVDEDAVIIKETPNKCSLKLRM